MEFMSWSLNAPSSQIFDQYMQKIGGKWEVIDPEAINRWGDSERDFFHMYNKYHKKIKAFGLHEFGVWIDGTIYDFRKKRYDNPREFENGYPVLNGDETDIQNWCPTSLMYLMETYPEIEYGLQFICFGQKVDRILHLNRETAWERFVRQAKKIAELYKERFPSINTIELDFEKTYTLADGDTIYYYRDENKPVDEWIPEGKANGNDWDVYRDFIVKVKNDVCIPLGMKLRVNMYAMTGDFTPSYYGWHDYKTLASGRDKNGNQAIDEFQIMSYDFTYAYSAPGPSTPLWWLEQILNHVDASLPNEKTWIGNAGYGRRWGLDNQQSGRAVTYKQLVMWQNGMYVHNHDGGDKWIWHKQSWLPFAGFNDDDSGYQVTYPHLYDKFNINHAKSVKGIVNRTTYGGKDIATSYFKSQQPIFTNIRGIANNPDLSGNISGLYTDNGITISGEYLGEDTRFKGAYRANKAQYQYDKNLDACVPVPDETGENGAITFNFKVNKAGRYKLIALIHFNTFTNNEIRGSLNGTSFVIGGEKLEDWFPFYIDKYAWLEVGTFDFNIDNTINIGISSGYIWGFVVCDDFDQNFLGGTLEFSSHLMPYYKRKEDGTPIKAELPERMVLTGELLRRPPRPAIIFEDNFAHMLDAEGSGYDFANIPYYMKVQDFWESGSNKVYYEPHDAYACTDSNGIRRIGFTDGRWILQNDGTVKASVSAGYSNQLVLYKKFKANIQVTATFEVSGTYPKAGIRLLATEEGNGNEGYLALLDYGSNKVRLVYENGPGNYTEIASAWMSDTLINLKGQTVTLYASVWNGKAYVRVEDRTYINGVELNNPPASGSYGVYISGGTIKVSLLNIATLDRYEPLEKMEVEIDDAIYKYGEVARVDKSGNPILYDKYGYLVYSGIDISETEDNLKWSEDYLNLPLANHPSWEGKKKIRVRMVDAGIWFTMFYIGDAEGFSIAYNSDLIGFIETTKMLYRHNCKGVAMWTMGQEDPLIFEYLPNT